jgi:hypothetical protein
MSTTYSFVYVARNDTYCGDAVLRLHTSIKCLVTQASRTKLSSYEIVIVDWNSHKPLASHEYFRAPLGDNIKLTFVEVPPEVSLAVGIRNGVSEVHGFNLGMRVASGTWVIRMDQDLLFGRRVFTYLLERASNLDPNEVWWSSRRESHPLYMEGGMDAWFDMHKSPANFVDATYPYLPLWTKKTCDDGNGAVGMFAMARETWHRLGGYHEALTGWGHMEVELGKYMGSTFPELRWLNLHDALDCAIVHIWHVEHNQAGGSSLRPMNTPDVFEARSGSNVDGTWGMVRFADRIRLRRTF